MKNTNLFQLGAGPQWREMIHLRDPTSEMQQSEFYGSLEFNVPARSQNQMPANHIRVTPSPPPAPDKSGLDKPRAGTAVPGPTEPQTSRGSSLRPEAELYQL